MFLVLALRDAVFLAVAVALWQLAAQRTAADDVLADFAGLLLGLAVGAGGYLLHEWGHLLGAFATRSRVAAPETLWSPFLFSFDSKQNDLRQFGVMSAGGFAATALVIFAFYSYLPDGLLATRIARGVVLVGAFLTVVIELPLVGYALLGRGLPPVENGIHRRVRAARPERRPEAGESTESAAA